MPARHFVSLAILAAVLLAGCSPAARLVGKWEVDAKPAAAPADNPLAAAMAAGMQAMFKVDAEFKADGTCSASGTLFGQTFSKQGKWRYEKSDGGALVLQVQMDGDTTEARVAGQLSRRRSPGDGSARRRGRHADRTTISVQTGQEW